MSLFGWSLPPGCGSLPGEESGACDLTKLVTLRGDAVALFWDEDGNLIESYPVQIPADELAGLPAYTEGGERTVGAHDWDDELDEAANLAAAARAYAGMQVCMHADTQATP
jgi:hypothetical protein